MHGVTRFKWFDQSGRELASSETGIAHSTFERASIGESRRSASVSWVLARGNNDGVA